YTSLFRSALGLPYVFASHFAPAHLMDALALYRERFKISEQLQAPYTMAGVNVVVADTDEEAEYLATSGYRFKLNIIKNNRVPLPPPVNSMKDMWNVLEEAQVKNMAKYSFIGSKETVRVGLEKFIEKTGVDELIISTYIHDQDKKLHSFKLLSELKG